MKFATLRLPSVLAGIAFVGTLLSGSSAHAQFIFNLDTGYQSTKYGTDTTSSSSNIVNPNNKSYSQGPIGSGVADMGLGFVFSGHSKRKYGYNLYALGDFTVPFKTDANTGGVFSGGGIVGANFRVRQFAVGTGFDLHEFSFPGDGTQSTSSVEYPQRPNELLVTVPVVAKYNFGPAARAYVQGGVGFIVANMPGKYSDGYNFQNSVTLNPLELTLADNKLSSDIRFGGGYSFGHLTARVSYIHRDVYFSHSLSTTIKSTTPATYFDFHQDQTTVGIVFTAF